MAKAAKKSTNKKPVSILDREEIAQLINACTGGIMGARNKAIILTLYASGLRIAELCDLKPSDVDTRNSTILVRNGKGGKSRTISIQAEAAAQLETWKALRATKGLNGHDPLFCALSKDTLGKPLVPRQIQALVTRLAKKAGIEKRVHPHAFRHSAACRWADNGADLRVIKKQLGHSSLAVTDRYIDHISQKAQNDAIQALPELDLPPIA